MTTLYRFADHVSLVPLVNAWRAWWCVVAPFPASMHAANYQLPVLEAYLKAPSLHVRASKNARLRGGPFLPIPVERAPKVADLLEKTRDEFAGAVDLAAAFDDFSSVLIGEARGQPLEALYARLPRPLRGISELVYDYHNRASIRLDEGMLYESEHYKPHLQSLRVTPVTDETMTLPFFNTPHLLGEDEVELCAPFADERARNVLALDRAPRARAEIAELLGIAPEDGRLAALLSDGPPVASPTWTQPRPRLRYFGHACVLTECDGCSILVDPIIAARPETEHEARFSWGELPSLIDWVIVTHAHPDHFALESLLRLRDRVSGFAVPRNAGLLAGDVSLKRILVKLGFRNVVELGAFDSIPLPGRIGGEIIALPFLGEHGDVAHCAKLTYVIRFAHEKILFFADSTVPDIEVYRRAARAVGPIQTVLLNTELDGAPLSWPYDSLFPRKRDRRVEAERRCRGSNAEEGLALLDAVGARRAFNYAMGLEPWLEPLLGPAPAPDSPRLRESDRLIAAARARGVEAERLCGSKDYIF